TPPRSGDRRCDGARREARSQVEAAYQGHGSGSPERADWGAGRLGEANTLNSLGELLSQTLDTQQARDHHARALAIAGGLGAPQEEARALEGIGRCHLQDGNSGEGAAKLQQAPAIYQRIGTPAAERVQQTLRER